MIGFFVAATCACGLIFMARRARRHWGRHGLYGVFQRLNTTPGQEQVIRTAFAQLKAAATTFRQSSKASRPELAELLRADNLEEASTRSWVAARERSFDELKPTLLAALKDIHEVLDAAQRKKLGDLVELGPRALFASGGRCGGWRHHSDRHPGC